jgi:hypothetical protein
MANENDDQTKAINDRLYASMAISMAGVNYLFATALYSQYQDIRPKDDLVRYVDLMANGGLAMGPLRGLDETSAEIVVTSMPLDDLRRLLDLVQDSTPPSTDAIELARACLVKMKLAPSNDVWPPPKT